MLETPSDFNDFIEEKANEGMKLGFTYEEAKHLASVYGSNVSILYHYMIENPSESLQIFFTERSLGQTEICT